MKAMNFSLPCTGKIDLAEKAQHSYLLHQLAYSILPQDRILSSKQQKTNQVNQFLPKKGGKSNIQI